MAQVNNTQANVTANPTSIRETIKNQGRETPPLKQKENANPARQEDRVDLGKPNLRQTNVTRASRQIDQDHEVQVKKENPPIQPPPQNTANINLSTRQEPQENRPPQVDSHSIRTTIVQGAAHRREPNVVEQEISAAQTAGARPKPNPGQTEAQTHEATARVQAREEGGQNANQTELRRSPAAVQTQKGQNVDKLT